MDLLCYAHAKRIDYKRFVCDGFHVIKFNGIF